MTNICYFVCLQKLYKLAQDMETSGVGTMRSVMDEGGCFPAGTRIQTDKGLVRIEDIKVGDMVLSKPESGEGKQGYKPVVRTVSYENKEVWELNFFEIPADTKLDKLHKGKLKQLSHKGKLSAITATSNHSFWVNGVGWTRLDELEAGQIIATNNPDKVLLVFFVHPVQKTNVEKVFASYSASNIFNADQRGGDIEDIDLFCFVKEDSNGNKNVLGDGIHRPSVSDSEVGDVLALDEIYTTTVYNFEVDDHHTYFVSSRGAWVHNTNCPGLFPDKQPQDLMTRSGAAVPNVDAVSHH